MCSTLRTHSESIMHSHMDQGDSLQNAINEFPEIKTLTSLPRTNSKTSQNETLDTNLQDVHLEFPSRRSSECRPEFTRVRKITIPSVQYWNKIGSVLNAISKFQKTEVTTIHDQFSLQANFKETESDSKLFKSTKHGEGNHKAQSFDPPAKRAIIDFRDIEKFFWLIMRSAPEDLILIRQKIEGDPKRFLHAENSPERLVNTKFLGQTPVYVACMNGHLNSLKLLLTYHADATILSDASNGKQESALEVAARWNHESIVMYLLKEAKWPNKLIQSAMKQTTSKKLKGALKKRLPNWRCF